MLSIENIRKILPYEFPFLLIDRVVDFKKGESLTAVKNITANDVWLGARSSFLANLSSPERRETSNVFPETLLIESAAQAALVLYKVSTEGSSDSIFFLGRVKAEFDGPVFIGDQVTINVLPGKIMKTGSYCTVDLSVDGEPKARVDLILGIRPKTMYSKID